MSMVVQHNMQAANANRMLGITSGAQAKSTEKLSSGYKINRAADDAAGLTISEKMRKQIRGLDKASSNAQDGVSSVQTAEGALTEVHSMLQRMNELAVQAANGTNSKDTDRKAIQDEIDQLNTEIDRVAETTKFNEIYLLKGDDGEKTINMKAHDAGLKGTLTDNGDGTATFKMDALKAGDKVSIGGQTFSIGASTKELKDMLTTADIDTKHQDVVVNGDTYKYVAAKAAVTTGTKADGNAAGWYKDGVVPADTGAGIVADADYADAAEFSTKVTSGTVKVGTTELSLIADKDNDGVDDNNKNVITKEKAYSLAAAELLKANQIGDTQNQAKVGIDKNYTAPFISELTVAAS